MQGTLEARQQETSHFLGILLSQASKRQAIMSRKRCA